jgi:hypothetical protein
MKNSVEIEIKKINCGREDRSLVSEEHKKHRKTCLKMHLEFKKKITDRFIHGK